MPHQPAEAHDMSGVHLPTYEELTAPREVAAGGLYNMRDLGRLPRRDGGHTRSGVFYRADDLSGRQRLYRHDRRSPVDAC